ncbi:MAG: hypothetical protein CSA51_01110 [Gammaproteobacteria bacterium]|nr:MAG: hypothetical protein CSA51_01110 [Gammaproteobacteria bacterium]
MNIPSMFRHSTLIPALFAVLLLGGCVPGTFESIGTTLFIYEKDLDSSYKHDVEFLVDSYVNELADSPCPMGEVRPIDPIVQQLKDHRYTGLTRVLSRLNEIANDTDNTDAVRASALYYQSVIYAMAHKPNCIGRHIKYRQRFETEYTAPAIVSHFSWFALFCGS